VIAPRSSGRSLDASRVRAIDPVGTPRDEPSDVPVRVRAVSRKPDPGAIEDRFVRAIYDEHGAVLLSYVTTITHDRHAAEDIVQETVLRAWRRAGQLARDGRPLRPWLMTVARNLALDRQRRASTAREQSSASATEGIAGVDTLDRALDAWQLADALRQLSPDHRNALVELYFRGRSVDEAATVLGVPPGTVKSRTYYALRALKLVLEEQGWASQ
jgi:RNA polymerase sigma-70 factor, ECF subfamily